ncbi:MAG: transglutaminase-like domain-containing protein [Gammaproteobacteria bacterium]|nr:transglutaminase-like domain-containing protein [Gammaproteobacteria bacterium]
MSRIRRVVGLLLATASLYTSVVLADSPSPFISSIAIERASGATGALPESLAATLHVSDPARTAASLSHIAELDVVSTGDASVRVRFGPRPTLASPADERFLRSTWVVDFAEDAVRSLATGFANPDGARPTPAELEHFVFDHIDDKTYSRSFDLASRVAAMRQGDCTEHAVLLTALARINGYSARIVFGNVIIDIDDGLFAYGHAWTEIYDGESWRILDATMVPGDAESARTRYLPIGFLGDEGPGYVLSMFELVNAMPTRISDVRGSP